MNKYRVKFAKSVQKELKKVPTKTALRLVKAIDKLSSNPRVGNVRPMVGSSTWRLRVGDYRVIYDIHENELVILVIRVRHRKDAYRNN